MRAFNVYDKDGKEIDTVFYANDETEESVWRSLVDHDGYDPGITVKIDKKNEKKNQ